MATIREIQEVADRLHDAGVMDMKAVLKGIYEELGDIPKQDLTAAFTASLEETKLQALDAQEEAETSLRMLAFMERAVKESGNDQITMFEAAQLLARKGDQQAQAYLDQFNSPQWKAQQEELEAAVAWHPDWRMDGHYILYSGSDEAGNDTEKLRNAYRKHLRGQ